MDLHRLDTPGVLRAGLGWAFGQGRVHGRGESGVPLGLCRRSFLGKCLPGVQRAASPQVSPRASARSGTTGQTDAQRACMWICSPPPPTQVDSSALVSPYCPHLLSSLYMQTSPRPAPQHTPPCTAGACPKKANQSTEKLRNPEGECAHRSLSSLGFWMSWYNEVMVVQATAPLKGDTL